MDRLNWGKGAYTVLLLYATTAISLPAQTVTTLHSFDNTDGDAPTARLVQATDGNFYGTTQAGGASEYGTVFKITPSGTLTSLHSFDLTDGAYPQEALVQASDGNFYGTTVEGGVRGTSCLSIYYKYGCGTVFTITPSGTLTTLYSLCSLSSCDDGVNPYGALVQGTDGSLYGTTQFGGANPYGQQYGTVFKITPSGSLTTLHSFDYTDGGQLEGALIQATDGNFYGTTVEGGAIGYGTVFKITPSGALTTLYSFCPGLILSGMTIECTDGMTPSFFGSLVQGNDGNFYGTTTEGGANNFCKIGNYYTIGCGTVFKITSSGALTTLYSFCSQSGCTDGSEPHAGLVQATDGNLYGTTGAGGAYGGGTVFKITPNGTLTTLYSFCSQSGCTDGVQPWAGLVQATNGDLYGTTNGGGAAGDGTVFSLSVGLGPFVETLPTSGSIGTAVTILGNNLTGATAVTFNGTAAAFTVVSDTEIQTTVPSGATTGIVQVTTPGGTLNSNVTFQVTAQQVLPIASVAPISLIFGAQKVGTASASQPVTLSNTGNAALAITSIGTSANFGQTNNCGGSVAASGACTINVTFSPTAAAPLTGTLTITDNNGGVTGSTQTVSLNAAGVISLTTTTLSSSLNPSVYGQAVTYAATVTSGAGAPPNGESVQFMNGATQLGSGTLTGGSASLATSALPAGTDSITAVYGGDSNFAGSTSNTVNEVVGKAISSTTLTSSPGPFVYGLPVTFTATVTSSAGAPPIGEIVTFKQGKTKLGTGQLLSGGIAWLKISKLAEGTDSVTASYGGDADFTSSASTLAISVVPPPKVVVAASAAVYFWPNPQYWVVVITNQGPGVAYHVRLASATVNGIGGSESPPGNLGNLAEGESRTITVTGGGPLLPGENVEVNTVTWTGGSSTLSLRFVGQAGP